VKVTNPVGTPTEEAIVAVSATGWPSVVDALLADNAVVVRAGVTVTEEAEETDPSFAESPL
jgi:hypothetical protein